MKHAIKTLLSLALCAAVLLAAGGCGSLFQNGEVSPVPFPRAAVRATKIALTDYPAEADALTVATLQGVLANVSETQILIKDGAYRKYLPYLDAEVLETGPEGAAWTAETLLDSFGAQASGYVLCDRESAAAAVSVAAALQAVAVYEELEPAAKKAGLELKEDVRGWDDDTLRKSEYFTRLSRKIAVEQTVALAPKLVDLAVMAGAYFGFTDTTDEKAHKKAFSFLDDNALVFGWNPTLGEYKTVASLSSLNACLVPADHGSNYSVLSGFSEALPAQRTETENLPAKGHTVCLVMTDGDNLQWMTTAYTNEGHYGSGLRGSSPMGWGIPASLPEIAAPMGKYLYENMTAKDEFITQIGGLGYTYPSMWKNKAALAGMAAQLAYEMERANTHIAAVLDDGAFGDKSLDTLASQQGIDGLFYFDYADYAGYGGEIRFVEDTPVIAARYRLWNGSDGCSPAEIAASINAASKDPASIEAYSLVAVHAWSGLDENGNFTEGGDTMKAVRQLVDALDADVRVVTPGEFVRLVKDSLT